MHLPGHNFFGPGTKDLHAEPTDDDDAVAKEHDLNYQLAQHDSDIRAADRKAIKDFIAVGGTHGLLGAAGLSAKYLAETFTGVQYPKLAKNKLLTVGMKRRGGTSGDTHSPEKAYKNSASLPGDSARGVEDIAVEEPHPVAEYGTMAGNTGGISVGGDVVNTVIGAGHNPASTAIFTKKFQVYSGAFQFTYLPNNLYRDESSGSPSFMTTPLCTMSPDMLPLFMTVNEWNNLPNYTFAKSCKITVKPLGYRLPFETGSTTSSFANSQTLVQCITGRALNHIKSQ